MLEHNKRAGKLQGKIGARKVKFRSAIGLPSVRSFLGGWFLFQEVCQARILLLRTVFIHFVLPFHEGRTMCLNQLLSVRHFEKNCLRTEAEKICQEHVCFPKGCFCQNVTQNDICEKPEIAVWRNEKCLILRLYIESFKLCHWLLRICLWS